MAGSSDDIQEYLNIIEGKFPINENAESDNNSVDLGTSTAGAIAGHTYLYDNGLRWAKLVEEDGDYWHISHGFLEYEADSVEYISKQDMTTMIRSGDMTLFEETIQVDILEETLSLNDNGFDEYMDRVERYLLINEGRETFDFEYDWSNAWSEGKTPLEAAEDAILSEG